MPTATDKAKPSRALAKRLNKDDLERAYAAILDGAPIPTAGDPEVVSRAIVERILAADTFEEAFKPQELEAWADLVGVPVRVVDFHLNPTQFTPGEGGQGASVYAVVDLELVGQEDQGIKTVTCGGRNVLAQLVKMAERGWSEHVVTIISKPTAEGYNALWLQAVE